MLTCLAKISLPACGRRMFLSSKMPCFGSKCRLRAILRGFDTIFRRFLAFSGCFFGFSPERMRFGGVTGPRGQRGGATASPEPPKTQLKGPRGAPVPPRPSRPARLSSVSWAAAGSTSCRHVTAAAERRSEAASGIESLDAASSVWWLAACHVAVGGMAAHSKVDAETVYGHDSGGDARPWRRF